MASHNRPTASSSMSPNNRVRLLWQPFQQSVSRNRTTILMEHKVNAAIAKADAEYSKSPIHQRIPPHEHKALKAKLVKEIKEPYFDSVRAQWHSKLQVEGLRAEDWTDMTNEEMLAVSNILGDLEDESDEDMVVVRDVPPVHIPESISQQYSTAFLQPLAPSLSASTRSTNVSTTSSYAVVNPSEFHSEDEDHFFMPVVATSHDLTSDDDDGLGLPIRHWPNAFDAWSSDSVASSLQNSVESPSDFSFPRPQAHKSSSSKPKISRQPYVGPLLQDPDEPLSDEEDFERFKMQTRIQKIVEFHQAAALADIELAVEIYKGRKAPEGDKQEVSPRVIEHQKRMAQMQMEKEEERKAIVKTERSKRRSELRRRPGRSATLVAPIPSIPSNPTWLNAFQEEVAIQVEAEFDLQKILSDDPNERHGNVEQFLQQMFPTSSAVDPSSSHSPDQNHFQQPVVQEQFSHTRPTGWGLSSASVQTSTAFSSASQASQSHAQKRRPSDVKNRPERKLPRKVRPSLFGDDEFSDDEDSSPSPETTNPFMNANAGAFLTNQLMEQPELAAAFAQWGGMGETNSAPPPTPAWETRPATQVASVSSTWATKDVRSTPVGSAWNRRKGSISTSQPGQGAHLAFVNPFDMPDQAEAPISLSAMAAINSANTKGKKPVSTPFEQQLQLAQEQAFKKQSPPISSPQLPPSKAPVSASTPNVPGKKEMPAPPPPAPVSKKQTKKQRQANKKGGTPAAATTVDEPELDPASARAPAKSASPMTSEPAPQQSTSLLSEPPAQILESILSMPKMIPGMARARKDSNVASPFSSWDSDVASTPRPAPKIPSHLQESMSTRPEGTPRPSLFNKHQMAEVLSGSSRVEQMGHNSTIKGSQWGSAATGAASRSAWSIFTPDASQTVAPQQAAASRSVNRDPWLPGGFDDGGGGGGGMGGGSNNGGDAGDGGDDEKRIAPQFWTPPARSPPVNESTSVPVQQHHQQSISAAQRLQHMIQPASASPAPRTLGAKAMTQPQAIPSPANTKKARGKKNGKGKKVTIEEVLDDEEDSKGESLPMDSRFIMEPKILEPKPSVPPTMFDSIISYGDEDEDEDTTSSSFAPTPSTAPSSPPDIFDGDDTRIAAAVKELQEGTRKMEKQFGGGVSNAGGKKQHVLWTPSSSDVETQGSSMFSPFGRSSAKPISQQTPIWGQLSAKDKGKGKMADLGGNEDLLKANPTIQNLKRSKAAAGGKWF